MLALPEDVLDEETDAADAAPTEIPRPGPGDEELRRLGELLAAAERPLVVVGEGGWSAQAGEDTVFFCEANAIPVVASFRCQDYVDNGSNAYAGPLTIGMDPALARRVEEADLLVAVGGRLGDVTTRGYTLLDVPRPRQTLVHVHPDPGELGRVYETDLPIVSDLTEFAAGLRRLLPIEAPRWSGWAEAARADYLANLEPRPLPGELDLAEVIAFLRRRLPSDAVFTCGAGNFTVWAHRFYEFSQYPTQLAPRSGAMGYGIPAALAAKALFPERLVVCLAGDGDFMMASSELATAVKHDLPVIILVVDNGMYGTIRMHQERLFPGRVSGTDLANPDFAAFARVVRLLRRDRRAHRGRRAGVRARRRIGIARGRDAAGRPRGDQPALDDQRAARGRRLMREEYRVEGLPEPLSHYTDAVRAGDLLFVSGIVPVDEAGQLVGGEDVVAQATQVFESLRLVLAAAGAGPADVVKVTVFLTDVDDRPLINPVRQAFFGEARPASTLVEISRLAVPGAKIEVEAVAVLRT